MKHLAELYEQALKDYDKELTQRQELEQKCKRQKEAIDKAIEFTNKNWVTWCSNHFVYMTELQNILKLDDELEIIEEPKKIEKLEPVRGSDLADLTSKNVALKNNSLIELCKTLKNMNNKINELIDEINNLKEK